MGPGDLLLLLLCSLFVRCSLSQAAAAAAAGDVYCEDLSPDPRVVSTAEEASTLAADLDRCPGLEFNVYWRGAIGVSQPFELSNSTTLMITGDSKDKSVLDGVGESTLFLVFDFSELYLEDLGLTRGYGDNGGAVTASGGASVITVNCDIYGNKATSNGGGRNMSACSFPRPVYFLLRAVIRRRCLRSSSRRIAAAA